MDTAVVEGWIGGCGSGSTALTATASMTLSTVPHTPATGGTMKLKRNVARKRTCKIEQFL